MRFAIDSRVFEALPSLCIGVVGIKDIANDTEIPEISALFHASIADTHQRMKDCKVKEHPSITPYREAFRKLGFNPNKYPCSIEALISRIAKGGTPPSINSLVDLVNAVSLKYMLPMGAHDMDSIAGGMTVRYSAEGEPFLPLGSDSPEAVPEGELVYADENEVRTRRWIWRQNDKGKVNESSSNIFMPIDGFADFNKDQVMQAMDELSELLEKHFRIRPSRSFLDRTNPVAEV